MNLATDDEISTNLYSPTTRATRESSNKNPKKPSFGVNDPTVMAQIGECANTLQFYWQMNEINFPADDQRTSEKISAAENTVQANILGV